MMIRMRVIRTKSQAAVRAKDLYDLGVVIELFPVSRPDQKFDRAKFYDV
jgi:ATP-dependent DNA helicase 2 subunit 1